MQEISAGILIYRFNKCNHLQVLLGKNGGPRWANKNVGAWNIPKGHLELNETLIDGAIREFEEETNLIIPKDKINNLISLGTSKTSKNKKIVYIFALEYDYVPNGSKVDIKSNLCETEYPLNSGIKILVPELEIAYYFNIEIAENLIFPYQKIFLKRLFENFKK